LIHMITTVSPGAKRGSTAPYAYSHVALVESGTAQPRTLQNAFINPVPTSGDVVENACRAMRTHLAALDSMYGRTTRAHATLSGKEAWAELSNDQTSMAGLAAWTRDQLR
jgi:CRISPR system Cascade subunit CasC